MKTGVKVLLAVLIVAVIGLTAGLIFTINIKNEKPDIEKLEIFANDANLVDITKEGESEKTYAVNLNNSDSFSLSYIANPAGVESYNVVVQTSNDQVISIDGGTIIQAGQTGVVPFKIKKMSDNKAPITLSFMASTKTGYITVKVKILITQPSTLSAVENIKYDGEKVTWDAVTSNTNDLTVDETKVAYRINLNYTLNGEDKAVVYTTAPGDNTFKLQNHLGGFETGTVNAITVQALGDNTLTEDSVISEPYKFYILKTPTYQMLNRNLQISNVDEKAGAVVMFKEVNGTYKSHLYRQASEVGYWSTNSIEAGDENYQIYLQSTVVGLASQYNKEILNVIEDSGVYYFDSPKTEKTQVVILDTPKVSVSNNNIQTLNVSGADIETYANTTITWDHVTDVQSVREKLRYLVTITNGEKTVNYNTETTSFELTNAVLNACRNDGAKLNTYNISVSAYVPAGLDDVTGEADNVILDNLMVIDSNVTDDCKTVLKEYNPAILDFEISVNDTNLTYKIPTNSSAEKLISEMQFVFVTNGGVNYTTSVSTSGTINLADVIKSQGDYNMYIAYKGEDDVINNFNLYVVNPLYTSVYKTIGAVTNASLDENGNLTFTKVSYADKYVIGLKVVGVNSGIVTYSSDIVNNQFNIIDYLNSNTSYGYVDIVSNYGLSDAYEISITTVSNKAGWVGATTSLQFFKFNSVTNIENNNNVLTNLQDDVIEWTSVSDATAYGLTVAGATDSVNVTVANSETSYNYKNSSNILNVLTIGDNTISVKTLGTKIDGIAILPSNPKSVIVSKLETPSEIKVVNDSILWNNNDNGVYTINILNGAELIKQYVVTNLQGLNNKLDLSTINELQSNNTYSIVINRVLQTYFDSDYSVPLYVKKLPAMELMVVEENSNYYITWQSSTLTTDLIYKTNASAVNGEEVSILDGSQSGYKYIDISSIKLNESAGLDFVGSYVFELLLGSNKQYDLADVTKVDPAYISSDVARINIVRLENPDISTNGYSVKLTGGNNVQGFDLKISKSGESTYLVESDLKQNNAVYVAQSLDSGNYVAKVYAYGNINGDYLVKDTYILNSATIEEEFIKLNAITLSYQEIDYKNKIVFNYTNSEIEDEVKYLVYSKTNDIDGYVLLNNSSYTIEDNGTYAVINLKTVTSAMYYVVCYAENDALNYMHANASNVLAVRNVEFVGSSLLFEDEDKITWSDTKINDKLVTYKHYLTIKGPNTEITYTFTNGEALNCVVSGISNSDIGISTNLADYGIGYDATNLKYTFDIKYLKTNLLIGVNTNYTVTLQTVGQTYLSENATYNNLLADSTLQFTYYQIDSDIVSVNDVLTFDISSVASGYTNFILKIEDGEEYAIDLSKSSGEVGAVTKIKYLINNNKLNIYLDSFKKGNYNANVKINKAGSLGVVTTDFDFSFEKLAPFGDAENQEILALDGGNLVIKKTTEDRKYYIYSQSQISGKSKDNLIATITGNGDYVQINTDTWSWPKNNTLIVCVQISQNGKIISNLSDTYTLNKLSSSILSMQLSYINYDINTYSISWDATNVSGTTDLASKYILNISGAYEAEIEINANDNNYYLNGTYTLQLNHPDLVNLDKTKNLVISLTEVKGSSLDITSSTSNYLSNNGISSVQVKYLPKTDNISINSNGDLVIAGYNYGATSAIIEIYKLIDTNYSNTPSHTLNLTETEVESGVTIDFTQISGLTAGTYKVEIIYIGNNIDTVTSEKFVKEDVIKLSLTADSVTVVDGKLQIANPIQNYTYEYSFYQCENIIYSGTYKCDSEVEYYEINTDSLPEGEITINMQAISSQNISSDIITKTIYKYYAVDDLQKSITYNNSSQQLVLTFTANNLVNGIDLVDEYEIVFTNKFDNSKAITKTLKTDFVTNYVFNDGKYTVTINNVISDYLNVLGCSEFTVSIISVGGQYIENVNIKATNTIDVVRLLSPYDATCTINADGNMVVAPYTTTYSSNTRPDKLLLTFVDNANTELIYTYEILNFGAKITNTVIDFTTEKVSKGAEQLLLPSGSYTLIVKHLSNDINIIDSGEHKYLTYIKTCVIDKITIETNASGDLISWSEFANAKYNYVIYDKQNNVVKSQTGITNNYIVFDELGLSSGLYKISVQIIEPSKLKSQYSSAFEFTKSAPVNLSANLVNDTNNYYILAEFNVPDINYTDKDLVTSYYLTINNLTYIIKSNTTSDYLALGGDNATKISVTFYGENRKYSIKIDIKSYALFDTNTAEILSSNAGKIIITGLGNVDAVEISVTKLLGGDENKLISSNTKDLATSKAKLEKLQTSGTTFEVVDGIINFTDSKNDISKIESTYVNFYKKVSDGVYDLTPIYTWQVTEDSLDINHTLQNLPSGEYLVAIQYIGDITKNVINSDILFVDENAVTKIVRVLDTPKVYIENGVLCWTDVSVNDEVVSYEITLVLEDDTVRYFEIIGNESLNTTGYEFEAQSYEVTIRAVSDKTIKSATSTKFVATKLSSPSIELIQTDGTVKLNWNKVENAIGYTIYDYSAKTGSIIATEYIPAETNKDMYEYNVNLDTELGLHYYYIISIGTETTISENNSSYVYGSLGYLSSSNNISNTDKTKITTSTVITNTTANIYLNNGIVQWNKVDNVDYYKLTIVGYDQNGNFVKQYITSTNNTYFDITIINDAELLSSKTFIFMIENKTVTSDYIVVSTVDVRPLKAITLINTLPNEMYNNICISSGMINYTINANYIEDFISDVSIADLFTSPLLEDFIKPIITINGVMYKLGEDITNHIFSIDGNNAGTYSLESVVESVDDSVTTISVYIPLPTTLPSGIYNVSLKADGNTTEKIEDIAILKSVEGSKVSGYKLKAPDTPYMEKDDYNMLQGVLKFTPSQTLDSKHIMIYQLTFVSTENAEDYQSVNVYVGSKNNLYNQIAGDIYYGGSLDTENNIISIDIYNLFVAKIELSSMYVEFNPLSTDVNYKIYIRSLGWYVFEGDTFEVSDKYFNSNNSVLTSTFKVLSAPKLSVKNESIAWAMHTDVESYIITFYNAENLEKVYTETIKELEDVEEIYYYTNIRNNKNLPAGVYNVKVIAIGNGNTVLNSREADSDDFIVQKLGAVDVIVKDGLYQWTNAIQYLNMSTADKLNHEKYYQYYWVEIYSSAKEYNENEDRFSLEVDDVETTVFELPENYPSKNEAGDNIYYQLKVYASTDIAGNICIIPSDDNLDYDINKKGRARSHAITGEFKIITDGEISWNDDNSDTNNYIVFVYDRDTKELLFTSKLINVTKFNIYSLSNQNNMFNAETGTYTIKLKCIDKKCYSDNIVNLYNDESGILRSLFSYSIDLQIITQPKIIINDGDISFNTYTNSLGEEMAKSRLRITGKFIVGGSEVTKELVVELDKDVIDFRFSSLEVAVIKNGKDIVSLLYSSTMSSDLDRAILSFIEGEKYNISIQFIGVEDETVSEGSGLKLLTTQKSIINIDLLKNPNKPANPKTYQNDTENKNIYDNIPNAIEFNNYIYWDYSAINDIFDIEIYQRTVIDGVIDNYELLYEYKLRYVDAKLVVGLYNVKTKEFSDLTPTNCCIYDQTVSGVYLAIDKALNEIVNSNLYDFSNTDLCVNVQAVGSTSELINTNDSYNATYHYNNEVKLAVGDNNPYVMTISLPSVPEDLAYDGNGQITWKKVDGVHYQLVVAYLKTEKTITEVNYENITRTIITKENLLENKEKLIKLLNLTSESQLNTLFDFSNINNEYFVDLISINYNTNNYCLKYLTSDIKIITLRAVGVMSDASNATIDAFVSNPTSIVLPKNNNSFESFLNGNGSKDYPFVITSISKLLTTYLQEECHYLIQDENNATKTINLTSSNWKALGIEDEIAFNGVLEGNNYKIIISYDCYESKYASIFYKLGKTACVRNLNIVVDSKLMSFDTNGYFGAVAVYNDGLIANVNISGEIIAKYNNDTPGAKPALYIGGVACYNTGTIAYCNVSTVINDNGKNSYVGGIVAYNGDNSTENNLGTIKVCNFSGVMYTSLSVGGIVHTMYSGTIQNCSNTGYVIRNTDSSNSSIITIGGLVKLINNKNSSNNIVNCINISNSFVKMAGIYNNVSSTEKIKVMLNNVEYEFTPYYSNSANAPSLYFAGISYQDAYKKNTEIVVKFNSLVIFDVINFIGVNAKKYAITSDENYLLNISFIDVKYDTAYAKITSSGTSWISINNDYINNFYDGTNKSIFNVLSGYVFEGDKLVVDQNE